jgi:hypothetical protein
VTQRQSARGTVVFILNHNDSPVVLPAHADCQDVLTSEPVTTGDLLEVPPTGVRILLTPNL